MLALGLYLLLAALTVRQVGVVGEVDLSWALGRAPTVAVSSDPLIWASATQLPTAGHQAGPLLANQVRPIEVLQLGPLSLPLAVNAYTGALPDWPARLIYLATGSTAAVTGLHVLLGGLFIWLLHRFLVFHGTPMAAHVAAFMLAADWNFLFYRKVLGGTELLLLAGLLLTWWALWSRRWAAGRHGLLALAVGVGMGLLAKITFVLSLVALVLAFLLMRWDRPRLRPPLPKGWWQPLVALSLLTAPLWLTWAHHALSVPLEPHVRSHDFPDLQLRRVWSALEPGGKAPARETLANLSLWAGNPLGFLELAYKATGAPGWSPWRLVGWVVVAMGVGLGWSDRHPTPHQALLRFTSAFCLLQVGLIWLVARDLHHLAVATPTLAVLTGLSIDRLASRLSPPKTFRRWRDLCLLSLPWLVLGVATLARTDGVVATITVPTFTRGGQAELQALLAEHEVQRLVVCDYESYGLLEILEPELEVVHFWAAASVEHAKVDPALVAAAAGGHLLIVEASAPMVYNRRLKEARIRELAGERTVERVGALSGDRAVLYAVGP